MNKFSKVSILLLFFLFISCSNDLVEEGVSHIDRMNQEFANGIFPDNFDIHINMTDPFRDGVEFNLTTDDIGLDEFLLDLDAWEKELKGEDPLFEGINFKVENRGGEIIVSNLVKVRSDDSKFLED